MSANIESKVRQVGMFLMPLMTKINAHLSKNVGKNLKIRFQEFF